ncbi:hypothetical protein OIV83_005251 [Microbotryomycetes sp. JL201]|nr:hypothetical protein OIV83_005251 [Microbotryomycetes sp. JL201]
MGAFMAKTSKFLRQAFACEPDTTSDERVLRHPYKNPLLLRYAFVTARVGSSLFMIPSWIWKYRHPDSRARPSWTLAQAVYVDFIRRVQGITELAGVQFGTRDVTRAPTEELKETRFEWIKGLKKDWTSGVLADKIVKPMKRVGTFVWEQQADSLSVSSASADSTKGGKIGIYLHGGGYTHFSAHEEAQTSIIPRRLMKSGNFESIYAVEYRLLPNFPFPAALQDAATVYCDLILRKGIDPNKVILIGDSAGGNIALALCRWIRLEQKVAMPGGMILLSPWCDPAHSFPETVSSYVPRPNPEDYLADEPAGRILLVASLLGHHPRDYVSDPYISPASQLGPHGCFSKYPQTFIHYSDAERLQKEIEQLAAGMLRDKVDVNVLLTKDGVHDLLMFKYWNETVRDHVWDHIYGWLDGKRGEGRQGLPDPAELKCERVTEDTNVTTPKRNRSGTTSSIKSIFHDRFRMKRTKSDNLVPHQHDDDEEDDHSGDDSGKPMAKATVEMRE